MSRTRVAILAAVMMIGPLAGCRDREIEVGLDSGLRYNDVRVGTGQPAGEGSYVEVHYSATLPDGEVIVDTRSSRGAHKFVVGDGTVIPGMDSAVRGMRSGGVRRVRMPANSHYGRRGYGGVVPPNTTLTFEIEAVAISPRPPVFHPDFERQMGEIERRVSASR